MRHIAFSLLILTAFAINGFSQNFPPELRTVSPGALVSGYQPGTVYQLLVSFSEQTRSNRAFQLKITNQANPGNIGVFEPVTNTNTDTFSAGGFFFVATIDTPTKDAWNIKWTSPSLINQTISFELTGFARDITGNLQDITYVCNYQVNSSSFVPVGSCTNSMQTGIFSPTSRNADVTLFPIPAVESITISYTAVQQQNTKIEIYDLSGKLMQQVFKGIEQQGESRHQVDVNGWMSGIYLVKTEFNGSVYYDKFSVR